MSHRHHHRYRFLFVITAAWLLLVCGSCNDGHGHVNINQTAIVEKPEEIDRQAEVMIQGTLKELLHNHQQLPDSLRIKNASVVDSLYQLHGYQPLWTEKGRLLSYADSVIRFIDSSQYYGLFPADYAQQPLHNLRTQLQDTSKANKLDAAKWARFDLLLSAGFVQLVNDLKKGRLQPDSILAKDSLLNTGFYNSQLQAAKSLVPDSFAHALEPMHAGYDSLKLALRSFIPKANLRNYTFIYTRDSLQMRLQLYQRLSEEDSAGFLALSNPDSVAISHAVKAYQRKKALKVDGKISTALIDRLNNTDKEKLIRIAITLDRYKSLEPLPQQYIWVNIPAFYMQVHDSDSVVLTSKVVVGKPITRTPVLTSAINYMVTYPQWSIPESIIKKEILPGLQRDPGYTIKKGYALIDRNGDEVDPYMVDWALYKTGIPYRVVQGSGDDNALGVMKFNFDNKYAVYLHDTNQRYLFSRSKRALSHGCVRVESWRSLAHFLLRNDSTTTGNALPLDTLNKWLALKEKHAIPVRRKLPLYIRYFGVEAKGQQLLIHDDIYGEDRKLRDRFFHDK